MTREFAFPSLPGHALCRETDPEAFFPEQGGSTREAKRICARCDVKEACLAWALSTGERFGVWGGLSESERRRLRGRGRLSINHGTEGGYAAHRRRKEDPCGACLAGLALAQRRRAAKKRAERERGAA